MMRLLLSVGNVRLKLISKLKKIFKKNYNHFILLIAGKDNLYLADVIYSETNKEYKILSWNYNEQKQDDEFFYQEVLYHFCRDRNLRDLPVYINLDDELVIKKNFDFPKIPPDDVKKAIAWELNDWLKDYIYNYTLNIDDEFCHVQVIIVEKKYLNNWRQIIKEQNLQLAEIFSINELNNEVKNISITVEDKELLMNELEWAKIKQIVYNLFTQQEMVLDNFQLTYLNWRNISILLGICILIGNSFMISYYVYTYYQVKNQQIVLNEQLYLKQDDKILIEKLKEQENIIKYKQNELKSVYKNDVLLYPLLLNLSVNTLDGVKLTNIEIKENHGELNGKAINYDALTAYKLQLEKIKFIKNLKVNNTNLNETDNLIDFNIYFDEVRENE